MRLAQAHAVLLRDRGVRVARVDHHAVDTAVGDGVEDVPWLVGVPTPGSRVPALAPAAHLLHVATTPQWVAELAATTLTLRDPDGPVWTIARDALPEDWFAAALRTGVLNVILVPAVAEPATLPTVLRDLLHDRAVVGVCAAVMTAAPRPWPGEAAQAHVGATWRPDACTLPSAPLPPGYRPSLADLASLGTDMSAALSQTFYASVDPTGRVHRDRECTAIDHDARGESVRLERALRTGCLECGTSSTSTVASWEDKASIERETRRLVTLVELNDRVQRALQVLPALKVAAPSLAAGYPVAATAVPDAWAAALECASVESAALELSVYNDEDKAGEPLRGQVLLAAATAVQDLSIELRRIGDPTAARALVSLLPGFTDSPALAGQGSEALTREVVRLLHAGRDPLAHAADIAATINADPAHVTAAVQAYLSDLDRAHTTRSGPLRLLLIRREHGWPAHPVVAMAVIQYGSWSPARSRGALLVVPSNVAGQLAAVGQGVVSDLGPLWPGEEPAMLATAFHAVTDYASEYDVTKAIAAVRATHHLLAAGEPVKYADLDGPAATTNATSYEGQRR